MRARVGEMSTRSLVRVRRWAPTGLAGLHRQWDAPPPGTRTLPAVGSRWIAIIVARGSRNSRVPVGFFLALVGRVAPSALLLLAIFPGNVAFAVAAAADPASSRLLVVAAWARLQIQVPLVWAALRTRRTSGLAGQPVPGPIKIDKYHAGASWWPPSGTQLG